MIYQNIKFNDVVEWESSKQFNQFRDVVPFIETAGGNACAMALIVKGTFPNTREDLTPPRNLDKHTTRLPHLPDVANARTFRCPPRHAGKSDRDF